MTVFAEPVDVAVIGGGPAGSATAIALAQLGRSVTVFERSHYESTRIGETLPPEIKRPLNALGIWERFLANGPIESPGIAAAWGQSELYENDFVVNPHGPGWHIDRRRFDVMLAIQATTLQVELLVGVRQITVSLTSSGLWRIDTLTDGQQVVRLGRILVDASGRCGSPIRQLSGPRIVYDRLVGLVGFTHPKGHAGDLRTLIEAAEKGWWYCSPLPDGGQVGALMTDGDLLPAGQAARMAFWQEQLAQSDYVRARLGQRTAFTTLRIVAACSSRSQLIVGDHWLTVGDASAAFDPLSSQGITWALESGLMAAVAIDHHLRGNQTALASYASQVESEFCQYLKLHAYYYSHERRWPHSPFWQRRLEKSEKSRKVFDSQSYLYS